MILYYARQCKIKSYFFTQRLFTYFSCFVERVKNVSLKRAVRFEIPFSFFSSYFAFPLKKKHGSQQSFFPFFFFFSSSSFLTLCFTTIFVTLWYIWFWNVAYMVDWTSASNWFWEICITKAYSSYLHKQEDYDGQT